MNTLTRLKIKHIIYLRQITVHLSQLYLLIAIPLLVLPLLEQETRVLIDKLATLLQVVFQLVFIAIL